MLLFVYIACFLFHTLVSIIILNYFLCLSSLLLQRLEPIDNFCQIFSFPNCTKAYAVANMHQKSCVQSCCSITQLLVLLAHCITNISLQQSWKIVIKCFSQEHNNLAIIRFKFTTIGAMSSTPTSSTTLLQTITI